MVNRRLTLIGFAVAVNFAMAGYATAFQTQSFDEKSFEAAQAAGKPILIEVTAPWCPTCKAQKPILSQLSQQPKFKDMMAFQIDFDSQKDLLRKFDAEHADFLRRQQGSGAVDRRH